MKPFDLPANANAPISPAHYWTSWPLDSYAAVLELAAMQYRCWARTQEALFAGAWGLATMADAGAPQDQSPMFAVAAADMRAAGAAVLRAQMDALNAFRQSA